MTSSAPSRQISIRYQTVCASKARSWTVPTIPRPVRASSARPDPNAPAATIEKRRRTPRVARSAPSSARSRPSVSTATEESESTAPAASAATAAARAARPRIATQATGTSVAANTPNRIGWPNTEAARVNPNRGSLIVPARP